MIVALLASAAGVSQAATSACAPTALAFNGTPVAADGCRSVDLDFVNIGSTFATASGTVASSGGTINTVPVPDTISTLTFTMNGGTNWQALGNGTVATGTLSSQIQNNGTNAVTDANYAWALSGLVLTPTFLNLGGGDTVTAVVTFCFGSTGSATVGSGGCVASNQGSINVTWNASATSISSPGGVLGSSVTAGTGVAGALSLSITPTLGITTAFISSSFSLNSATGNGVGLSTWATGINQTAVSTVPEPGTMGLMGLSLIGLGFLARRRK